MGILDRFRRDKGFSEKVNQKVNTMKEESVRNRLNEKVEREANKIAYKQRIMTNEQARNYRQGLRNEQAQQISSSVLGKIIGRRNSSGSYGGVRGQLRQMRGRQITYHTAQNVAAAVGQRLPSEKGRKIPGKGRGRPQGASGKYIIPGKGAVGVYEFRRWARQQARMRGMTKNQMIAAQMARQQNYQYQAPQQQQQYPQTQQYPQQMPQVQPQMAYNQPNQVRPIPTSSYSVDTQQQGQPIQQIQPQPQFDGNMMKIQNPFLNMGRPQPQMPPINPYKALSVFNVQPPVTNPGGEYYTENNMFNGQPMLKRRNSEGPSW